MNRLARQTFHSTLITPVHNMYKFIRKYFSRYGYVGGTSDDDREQRVELVEKQCPTRGKYFTDRQQRPRLKDGARLTRSSTFNFKTAGHKQKVRPIQAGGKSQNKSPRLDTPRLVRRQMENDMDTTKDTSRLLVDSETMLRNKTKVKHRFLEDDRESIAMSELASDNVESGIAVFKSDIEQCDTDSGNKWSTKRKHAYREQPPLYASVCKRVSSPIVTVHQEQNGSARSERAQVLERENFEEIEKAEGSRLHDEKSADQCAPSATGPTDVDLSKTAVSQSNDITKEKDTPPVKPSRRHSINFRHAGPNCEHADRNPDEFRRRNYVGGTTGQHVDRYPDKRHEFSDSTRGLDDTLKRVDADQRAPFTDIQTTDIDLNEAKVLESNEITWGHSINFRLAGPNCEHADRNPDEFKRHEFSDSTRGLDDTLKCVDADQRAPFTDIQTTDIDLNEAKVLESNEITWGHSINFRHSGPNCEHAPFTDIQTTDIDSNEVKVLESNEITCTSRHVDKVFDESTLKRLGDSTRNEWPGFDTLKRELADIRKRIQESPNENSADTRYTNKKDCQNGGSEIVSTNNQSAKHGSDDSHSGDSSPPGWTPPPAPLSPPVVPTRPRRSRKDEVGPSSPDRPLDLVLFKEDPSRVSLYPIRYHDVWEFYKKAFACIWSVDEIDMSTDLRDWATLTPDERFYIKIVLAFFLGADRLVNNNLLERFTSEVRMFECLFFYQLQMAVENIHTETYNLLVDVLVEHDLAEKDSLLKSVEHYPSVREKYDWCRKWTRSLERTFEERLVAFACVEGIFFSSSFAAIFWLKRRGLMRGLTFSNELISRDEGLHCDFAVMLYKNYTSRLTPVNTIRQIVSEACRVEKQFVAEALVRPLTGINRDTMCDYVDYIGERLMLDLCGQRLHTATPMPENPLDFMENITLEGKTNFFERKVSEYRAATDV